MGEVTERAPQKQGRVRLISDCEEAWNSGGFVMRVTQHRPDAGSNFCQKCQGPDAHPLWRLRTLQLRTVIVSAAEDEESTMRLCAKCIEQSQSQGGFGKVTEISQVVDMEKLSQFSLSEDESGQWYVTQVVPNVVILGGTGVEISRHEVVEGPFDSMSSAAAKASMLEDHLIEDGKESIMRKAGAPEAKAEKVANTMSPVN